MKLVSLKQQIARIGSTVGILLLIHTLIVYQWDRNDAVAASQWGQNIIRTETFLFNSMQSDCVLVGSSMSAGLRFSHANSDDNSMGIFNLAQAGGSPMTGMQLVEMATIAPSCLLVEANLAYKKQDDDLIRQYQNPIWFFLKRNIKQLRHENQPLNMLLTFVREIKRSRETPVREVYGEPKTTDQSRVEDKQIVNTLSIENAANRIRGLQNIPEDNIVSGAHLMRELADRIEAKGTKVIFFEMPGEKLVRSSRYYQVLRAQFDSSTEALSNKTNLSRVLHRIDIGDVNTTDGIHLDSAALKLVPHELLELIRSYGITK